MFTLKGHLKKRVILTHSPSLLAVDTNLIVVMDISRESRCSIYSRTLTDILLRSTWISQVNTEYHFRQIAINQELLYVTDSLTNCIHVFSVDGKKLARLGHDPIVNPGQCYFDRPTALWVSSRFIFVGDAKGIYVLTKDGLLQQFHCYASADTFESVNTASFISVSDDVLYMAISNRSSPKIFCFELFCKS